MTEKPVAVPTPDLEELRKVCQELVDIAWGEDRDQAFNVLQVDDSGHKHHIFEAAMEALFGPAFFDLWNERSEEFDDGP